MKNKGRNEEKKKVVLKESVERETVRRKIEI
jgi:hypothetical protein